MGTGAPPCLSINSSYLPQASGKYKLMVTMAHTGLHGVLWCGVAWCDMGLRCMVYPRLMGNMVESLFRGPGGRCGYRSKKRTRCHGQWRL